jgi:hypothetical protein
MSEAVIDSPVAGVTVNPIMFPSKVKRPRKRINKALAGVLVATTKQSWDELAPKVGAANGNSLRVNMFKSGVTQQNCRPEPEQPITTTQASVTLQVVTEAAELLRKELNGELLAQVNALKSVPATFDALASKGQGRAGTVKQIAETWRTLNGNPDQVSISFGVGQLDRFQPDAVQPVIEVESVPAPE